MNDIPDEIRAKLKRLSPYVGDNLPDSVREQAKYFAPGAAPGWRWDDGTGFWQYELLLCDIDAVDIDPAGYVAIVPLERCTYWLRFVLCLKWPQGFDPEDLIFDSVQEAKSYLDTLLAVSSPQLPLLINRNKKGTSRRS
jgi:hypothetical protein